MYNFFILLLLVMKIVLAHRGITYNYKDNTLKSLFEIFKYKSDKYQLGVELDINLSKDHKVFIYHDREINGKELDKLNYEEIINLDDDIPLLEDILIKFNNTEYFLNIEIKSYHEDVVCLCYYLSELMIKYPNIKYLISSFDLKVRRFLRFAGIICYKISDIDEKPGSIIHYSQENEHAIGVYTIFDSEFEDKYLDKALKYDIVITDDIQKLLNYVN